MPNQAELNDDFPVNVEVFISRLKGTPDEVWVKLLRNAHGREKHSERDWLAVLNAVKGE
jgi:hypothetical protein